MKKTARLSAVQALLRRKRIPALLVSDPLNVRYLTGLKATEALLVVKQTSATLIVDGRYIEVARRLRSRALRVADRTQAASVFARVRRCGFEDHHVTVERLTRWKRLYKSSKFVQCSRLVEGLRRKKDRQEIHTIKRALSITNAVLAMVPDFLEIGVTEKDVSNRILQAMLERGADGVAFESIVAFGKNSSLPHHRAGSTKLRSCDIVQVDIGAKVDGYCADRSEVYFVGEATAEQRAAYNTVHDAKRRAIVMAKAGARCSDIDARARDVLAEHGFESFPHALGHGVGLDVHEGVTLSGRSSESLLSGEVVAIEPGVYIPGRFGIRLEDTVFVK